MADFRTKAVTPATISYTPLDLSKIRGQLGKKVQEVEGAADAGNNLMSQLNFKDGYMTSGLARKKQNEYTGKIKGLVDDLYSNGDTRSFSSQLASLANSLNTDEEIKAGQKDYEFSKVYDGYGLDPAKAGFYIPFTDDNTLKGKINSPLDWQSNTVTSEDIQNAYTVYGGANLYKDYKGMFGDLNSTQFTEFLDTNSLGQLVFKTTKGPSDLPQEIGDFTQTELAAQALQIVNPNLYRALLSDYENGATSSASTYKDGMKRTAEDFIGSAVLENIPFVEDIQYDNKDLKGEVGDKPDGSDTVGYNATAFATMVEEGSGSQGFDAEQIAYTLNYGSGNSFKESDLGLILSNKNENESVKNNASYVVSLIEDYYENQGGAQLNSAAEITTAEILSNSNLLQGQSGAPGTNPRRMTNNSALNTPSSFVEVYKGVIGDQNPVTFFHKILNTKNYLGDLSSDGFDLDNKERLITDYDDPDNRYPEYSNHLTNGIGFLTRDELLSVLDIQENDQFSTTATTGSTQYNMNHLGSAITAYNKASDYYQREAGGKYFEINREMPFDINSKPFLDGIKTNSPIAYHEMAVNDHLQKSSTYYTDVRVATGRLGAEVTKAANKQMADDFRLYTPSTIGNDYELFQVVVPTEGGTTGLNATGISSTRVTSEGGKTYIASPYQKVEFSTNQGQTWLKDYQSFGAGTSEDIDYGFHGIILPGGRSNDTGLLMSKTTKNGDTTQWLLKPKTSTAMTTNPLFDLMKGVRKNLTGATYAPKVTAGDAFINKGGTDIHYGVLEEIDIDNVEIEYAFVDTKAQLQGTSIFTPQDKIRVYEGNEVVAAVDNMYTDGNTGVVADIQSGREVYRLRSRDGTGDRTWGEYLNNFQEEVTDPSNTYLGAQDYRDFVISLHLNMDYINQNGGNVNKTQLDKLLANNTMQSIQNITTALNSDWDTLTNIPITFFNKKDALYHFSGQPGKRGEPDSFGNTQSGYMVK